MVPAVAMEGKQRINTIAFFEGEVPAAAAEG